MKNNLTPYQKFELILEDAKTKPKKQKLLLHSCCGPCSTTVLEILNEIFDITILYYNPNIYPEKEYIRRRDELVRLIEKIKGIKYIEIPYQEKEYYQAVKGLEHLGEKSERCYQCYLLRMKETANYAKANNFDYFTTTLSISPHKNSDWINEIGKKLEEEYNVSYLYADFKKKGGYQRSLELSKKYGLYRQDYCGCIYSKLEREEYESKKNSSRTLS